LIGILFFKYETFKFLEIGAEDKTNVLNVTNLKKKVDEHERLKIQLKERKNRKKCSS
jgi:hypothetical protein